MVGAVVEISRQNATLAKGYEEIRRRPGGRRRGRPDRLRPRAEELARFRHLAGAVQPGSVR